MPQTFIDATIVADALGIKYLWIDALCIIQDSPEDWVREAGQMAAIYAHGCVNLAATYPHDSSGGLLDQTKDSRLMNPVVLDVDWNFPNMKLSDPFVLWEKHKWITYVNHSQRATRGWVLQETVFPPHAIHFTSDQIRRSCDMTRGCEAMQIGRAHV